MSDESMKESKPVLATDASVPFYPPAPYSPAKSRISMYVDEPMNRMTGRPDNDVSITTLGRGSKKRRSNVRARPATEKSTNAM